MRSFNWKKKSIPAVMLILIVALTGCGVELTDEQNRLIAEYAADLLLEYDKDYQDRYNNTTDLKPEDAAVAATEESVTEVTTEAPAESSERDSEDVTEESSTVVDDIQNTAVDIAEIVGIPDISIVYNDCMFLERYPSMDSDGSFIYLDADEGYKLVVVKFDIINASSQAVTVDLLNTDINYQLVMNGSNAARPMLTILMDDLGTFSNTIPANSEQSAVLIFQMSDSSVEHIESLDIKAVYQSDEYVIHIQ